jgi:hypothetical protein
MRESGFSASHRSYELEVVAHAEVGEELPAGALRLLAERSERGRRDSLGDQRLRCSREEDRLLQKAPAAHEQRLLPGVLGVVAGVNLVRRVNGQYFGPQRNVGIEDDTAAQASEVVVEAAPRLVRDELHSDRLPVRQAEKRLRAAAELRLDRLDRRKQRARRELALAPPRAVALAPGPVPGQEAT